MNTFSVKNRERGGVGMDHVVEERVDAFLNNRIKGIRALMLLVPLLGGCLNENDNRGQETYIAVDEGDAGMDVETDAIEIDAAETDSDQSDVVSNDVDADVKNVRSIEPELQNSEYAKILDTYPNLQNLRQKLLTNFHKYSENDYDSWYRLVLDLVVNSYDPEKGFQEFVDEVQGRLVVEKPDSTFLIRVAQSLWVEKNKMVPWSIEDYSDEEIEFLFATNGLYMMPGTVVPISYLDEQDVFYTNDPYKEAQVEEDMAYQLYPIARKLLDVDVDSTTRNVVRWVKNNFFHFNYKYGEELYVDGRVPAETNDWGENYRAADLKRLFDERVEGCHGPALLVAAMLKVLNIPAQNYKALPAHGVTYLPTMDKFVHGDHMVMYQPASMDDNLIEPSDFVIAANSGDEMMNDYLEATSYCDEDPSDGTYCPCRSLERDGDSLVSFSFGGTLAESLSSDCFENMQREMRSYNVTMLESDGHSTLMTYPLKIRGLEELADPEVDVW